MHVHSRGERWFDVANYTVLATLAFVCFYPFVMMTVLSINAGTDSMRGGITLWPRVFTLVNYRVILENAAIQRAYVVTVMRTVIGTGERRLRHRIGRLWPGRAAPSRPQVHHGRHGDPDVFLGRAHPVLPAAPRSAADQHLLGLRHPAAVQHLERHRHEDLLSGDSGQPQGVRPARRRQRVGGPVQDRVPGFEAAVRRDLAVRGGRSLERLVRRRLLRHPSAPAAGGRPI